MKGLLIAEHLGAIVILMLAVAWLVGLQQYAQTQLTPLHQLASAYHVANVALVTGAPRVWFAGEQWQVAISSTRIEVVNLDTDYHQTLRRDAD